MIGDGTFPKYIQLVRHFPIFMSARRRRHIDHCDAGYIIFDCYIAPGILLGNTIVLDSNMELSEEAEGCESSGDSGSDTEMDESPGEISSLEKKVPFCAKLLTIDSYKIATTRILYLLFICISVFILINICFSHFFIGYYFSVIAISFG